MGYDFLLEIIETIGPIALFLVLCLGLIGIPLPNEAVALTAGALSEADVMTSPIAYLMIALGICSAMSFNFFLGKFTSSTLGGWFSKKQKLGSFVKRSQQLTEKYGMYAIPLSVFFPFVRHATPYVMGMNRLKFLKFAMFAFPAAFVWSSIYFMLGHFVGDNMPEIIRIIHQYEGIFLILGGVMLVVLVLRGYRNYRMKNHKSFHE